MSSLLHELDHGHEEHGQAGVEAGCHVEDVRRAKDLKDLAGDHREDEPPGRSADVHEGRVVRLEVGQHSGQPGQAAGELEADEEAHEAGAEVEEVGVWVSEEHEEARGDEATDQADGQDVPGVDEPGHWDAEDPSGQVGGEVGRVQVSGLWRIMADISSL